MDTPILWHLPISHYSEKVRWALELKSVDHVRRAPAPGMHMALAAWLTRGRQATLPVLELDGEAIGDSTDVISALEERFPDPPLYPREPALRARALEIEDWFDEHAGPSVRRVAFHELRREPERFDALGAQAAPELFTRFGRMAGSYGRAFTGRRYGAASEHAAEAARGEVVAAFDRLESELGENEYMVDGRFTVADLTAASLLFPIVLPTGSPISGVEMPARYERFRASLSSRPGWRWVERMFARHRRRPT
jgi:glutathione S-transferase